jgi:AcrR family transcriptional regulator
MLPTVVAPSSPASRGAASYERILRVAIELFAEKGYHGTGVAEIGERAGLKRGALYYHIGSKEELLFRVLRPHIEDSLAGEQAIVALDADPREKFHLLARHHVRTIVDHQQEVAIVVRDLDALTDRRRAEIRALQDEVEDVWQRVLDEGAAAGVFATGDRVVVRGILSMLNMVFSWYKPGGDLTPESVADRYSEMLLEGLLA